MEDPWSPGKTGRSLPDGRGRSAPPAPARQALPAKLTRPTASGLIQRERLFARLDRSLQSKVIWISGPGGAGKTSLVSSFIEARGLDCIWYQVDASDADLASFVHYLRLAARDYPGEPLPAFTAAAFRRARSVCAALLRGVLRSLREAASSSSSTTTRTSRPIRASTTWWSPCSITFPRTRGSSC